MADRTREGWIGTTKIAMNDYNLCCSRTGSF
jgi:hypothetical protein